MVKLTPEEIVELERLGYKIVQDANNNIFTITQQSETSPLEVDDATYLREAFAIRGVMFAMHHFEDEDFG
jgi:hypothetical protein